MLQLSEKMSRLGTETAFEVLARAEALAREGRDIINLGIGQPDFKSPPHVVDAAIKALKDGHHGYTPSPGIPALREAVAADILQYRGVEVAPDRVVVVPGGKVTMFFAILMFGEPGAEILYPNPGFPIYESMINFSGATAVPTPLLEEKDFSFDAEEVLALITPRTRLLIVNSPANPTGGAVSKDELDRLVAGLEAHPHVAIMSDEIYGRLTYANRAHASLLAYPSAHLTRRLEQDVCDDGLAHGLCGVARSAGRRRVTAGSELPLLRQRLGAIRRDRRARRTARCGGRDGQRIRRAAGGHRGGAERAPWRALSTARRCVLRLP